MAKKVKAKKNDVLKEDEAAQKKTVDEIVNDSELFFKELKTDLVKAGEVFKAKVESVRDVVQEASDGGKDHDQTVNYLKNMIKDLALFPFEIDEEMARVEIAVRAYHQRKEES